MRSAVRGQVVNETKWSERKCMLSRLETWVVGVESPEDVVFIEGLKLL